MSNDSTYGFVHNPQTQTRRQMSDNELDSRVRVGITVAVFVSGITSIACIAMVYYDRRDGYIILYQPKVELLLQAAL